MIGVEASGLGSTTPERRPWRACWRRAPQPGLCSLRLPRGGPATARPGESASTLNDSSGDRRGSPFLLVVRPALREGARFPSKRRWFPSFPLPLFFSLPDLASRGLHWAATARIPPSTVMIRTCAQMTPVTPKKAVSTRRSHDPVMTGKSVQWAIPASGVGVWGKPCPVVARARRTAMITFLYDRCVRYRHQNLQPPVTVTCVPSEDVCAPNVCNPASSKCEPGELDCDDHNACTTELCDSSIGCEYLDISCEDNHLCTDDFCDSQKGCQHARVECDDNGDVLKVDNT